MEKHSLTLVFNGHAEFDESWRISYGPTGVSFFKDSLTEPRYFYPYSAIVCIKASKP